MGRPISRRTLLGAGLAAAVSAPFVSACSAIRPGGAEADAIRFSSYGDPTKLKIRGSLADTYMKLNPDAKIAFEGTATAGYWDKLATQMAGGNAPDVINIDSPRMAQYGRAGALQALDGYVPGTVQSDQFDQSLLVQGQVDGKQLGLPVATATNGIGYDQTVLEEIGLKAPDGTWTWDDYADYATEVHDASKGKYFGAEDPSGDPAFLELFVRSRGEQLYSGATDFGFSRDTLQDWFAYWSKLRAAGGCVTAEIAAQAEYGDWPNSPLVTKKAPLGRISTPNLSGGFQSLTDDVVQITLVPRASKSGDYPHYPAASSYLSLNARSAKADEAAKFLNWFVNSKEAALTLRLISGPPASTAGREALAGSGDLTPDEKKVLDFTEMALTKSTPAPGTAPAANTAVADLLLKASQDIAFERASAAKAIDTFLADGKKALASS
ncbi:ABC transporter substrate-binding protein [Microlunatus flavus]|uniref:Multiple sugar transport system substrate-binding protein n=1 Tax=Microlunatus flavus TaxID=1036181 RepID=A0A1H9A992_9ACTN|nr:extracellular solute-binding protein [Microlunatus flavus]SEP73302.1 multiple sugar transport system substrate-binding protein [Microlunatus flavus]